jgi:diguanylate cyclase (GGDEF)-like protein
MKLQHKIIILPVMVLIAICIVGMLAVEYQVKLTLQNKFKQELQSLSLFALSATEAFDENIDEQVISNKFDLLADKIAAISDVRISYFSYNGVLLGDSELSFADVRKAANYHDRAEIISALANNSGFAQRYDKTLAQNRVYYAKFDVNTGIIARVAAPENAYSKTIVDIRWGFTVIILFTILASIIFAAIAIRLFSNAIMLERTSLKKEIIAKTKEITLIQTMTTMVNNVNSVAEAGAILANILPKLLPELSGAIYLTNPPEKSLVKIAQWGQWPEKARVTAAKQTPPDYKLSYSAIVNIDENYLDPQLFVSQCFGVNLVSDQHVFGRIYFYQNKKIINETMRTVIKHLVEPINCALANVRLKVQLQEQATKDPLTALYNRRFMLAALGKALHQAERYGRHLAVLMIDLDYFKDFNDKFGHEAGDLVLSKVAEQFIGNLRLEDIACRYGGEEFCLICPETNLKEAYLLAEKLRHKIAALSLTCRGKKLDKITMSTGIAIYPNHAENGHDLMIQADKALYLAKNNGRNCTVADHSVINFGSLPS